MYQRFIYKKSQKGGILPLVVATFITVLFVLAAFLLGVTRLVGSHQEQMTAIESAALVASRDISQIVIEDSNFGFVGLSDRAPTGTSTRSGDNCFNSVRSINTLFATIRLDMIIADKLNNSTMRALSKIDYDRAVLARAALRRKLSDAIAVNGSGVNADGRVIEPYKDALADYERNVIRMNGGSSRLVPNSLSLRLGTVDGLVTNTQIPNPFGDASMSLSQQSDGCYNAFENIPYNSMAFVFTALGDDVALVDQTKFKDENVNDTSILADIVRAEATQEMEYNDHSGRWRKTRTKVVACAEPFNSLDPVPAPGAFELRFPNGSIPEIVKFGDILLYTGLLNSPTDYLETPINDDAPSSTLSSFAPTAINNEHPPFGKVIALSFYDWVRRGRHRVNITSLIDKLNQPLPVQGGPVRHRLELKRNGDVGDTVVADDPNLTPCVSNNQYQAISGMIINSRNGNTYDAYLRDFCYQISRPIGGKHSGEPLDEELHTVSGGSPGRPLDEPRTATLVYANDSGTRTTYTNPGKTVQLTLRKRN